MLLCFVFIMPILGRYALVYNLDLKFNTGLAQSVQVLT